MSEVCPYCGAGIERGVTRDHIMPRHRARELGIDTRALAAAGVRVTRPSHGKCNRLLAMAGECPAVLECARAVALSDPAHHRNVRIVLRDWRLFRGLDPAQRDLRGSARERRQALRAHLQVANAGQLDARQ